MADYTPEDLLCYLYHEMPADESARLDQELAQNWALREKLSVLKSAQQRLNHAIESPRTEVVLNVLRYAAENAPVVPASGK